MQLWLVLNQHWSRRGRKVDAGSATFLEILDDTERDTVNLCLQNAALVADDAWEQTARGHYGLSAVGPLTDHGRGACGGWK